MVIPKNKNQVIVAVKIKCLIILICLSTSCLGQIEGKYKSNDGEDYILLKEKTFEFFQAKQLQNALGRGTYRLSKSRLVLSFETFETKKQSSYQIKKEVSLDDGNKTWVNVKVYEESISAPFSFSPIVHLINSKNELITLFTDANGQVQYMYDDRELKVESLLLRLQGYETLKVRLDDYSGYQISIESVVFPEDTLKITKGKWVLPYRLEEERLILVQNGVERVFIKEGS